MSFKKYFLKLMRVTFYMVLLMVLVTAVGVSVVYWYFMPQLPSTERLQEVQLQVPLRVYTKDEKLIAEFGEQRRMPLMADEIPKQMINAVLAAEDNRFYEHPGVDLKGLTRAIVNLVMTGEKSQGGSTITMQVARNFFLSPEKRYVRKLKEILLAIKIENELSKDTILELYLNKIFFGHRAYGIGAAAQVYYGRPIQELTLAEYAMLAGLPKAPSTNNPVTNPERARDRRNYILKRMLDLNYISSEEYQKATGAPVTAYLRRTVAEANAPYIAEMVRAYMQTHYGDAAYTDGYRVYTTITSELQDAATHALHKALYSYDERHGYRGALEHVKLPTAAEEILPFAKETVSKFNRYADLHPSLVLEVKNDSITVYNNIAGVIDIGWENLNWARKYLDDNRVGAAPRRASNIVSVGDVIYARPIRGTAPPPTEDEEEEALADEIPENPEAKMTWRLSGVPKIQGALVSLRPDDGAIMALVGGFDFYHSKFNRVIQALRQPGSNFKPFIYSAALEHGYNPATMINDAPIVYRVGNKIWRPENYSHRFYGPTSLRKALTYSRNLVSIRVLEKVGIDNALDYAENFGFKRQRIPRNLTIALGTGEITPMELVRGYAVFANGGYLIDPYLIERIDNYDGKLLYQANPPQVCRSCEVEAVQTSATIAAAEAADADVVSADKENKPEDAEMNALAQFSVPAADHANLPLTKRYAPRAIRPQNAWLMTSILQDVVSHGTAARAKRTFKDRNDLAGKTGTTNGPNDAWFSGYMPDIVTTTWVGFDRPRPLGKKETGGRAALPMWIEFMKIALRDRPERKMDKPAGLITVSIDPNTGLLARPGQSNTKSETFFTDAAPKRYAPSVPAVRKTVENRAPSTPPQTSSQMLW